MKLAIIILSGDTLDILFRCFAGIRENVQVEYKIYLAYNGRDPSAEAQIREYLQTHFHAEQYKIVKYDFYNFAVLNNDIVRNHLDPDYGLLLFCNNDVIIQGDVVNRMVQVMVKNPGQFGTIGCRLLFEDGTIQHDGQFLSVAKTGDFKQVGHLNMFRDPNTIQLSDRMVIGNTFALCLSTLEVFNKVGGLNEKYKKCFEDVEFNLLCMVVGRVNLILDSQYFSYHLESYSRKNVEGGAVIDSDDIKRLIIFTCAFVHADLPRAVPLYVRTD